MFRTEQTELKFLSYYAISTFAAVGTLAFEWCFCSHWETAYRIPAKIALNIILMHVSYFQPAEYPVFIQIEGI